MVQVINGQWRIAEPSRELVEEAKVLTYSEVEARAQGQRLSDGFQTELEARVGTHFGRLAPELTKGANDLVSALFKGAQTQLPGISAEIAGAAGGVVAAAQAIASGDAVRVAQQATGLIGAALTPILGPLGPVAGGLAAMALGAFFGDESPPPPPIPPPKPRDLAYKPPGNVPLWQVLEEVWLASQRWHRGLWVPIGDARRALDFTFVPGSESRGGGTINTSMLPAGHAATWRIPRGGGPIVPKAARYEKSYPLDSENLGHPVLSKSQAGNKYVFNDDALAEFTGYNQQAAATFSRRLEVVLGVDDARLPKKLAPFTPYFASFGWAEYITATALINALAFREIKLTRDLGSQDYRNVRAVSKDLVRGIGNKDAYRLAATPLDSGTAMLCRVWAELQLLLATTPQLQLQAANANNRAITERQKFEAFVTTALKDIQASLGRIEPAAETAAANTDVIRAQLEEQARRQAEIMELLRRNAEIQAAGKFKLASAWPIALGAGAVALTSWVALRQRPQV